MYNHLQVTGKLGPGVTSKDVILHVIGTHLSTLLYSNLI